MAYHAAFYTRISTQAWLFAGLFLLEAGLFAWWGVVRGRLRFSSGRSARHLAAVALVACSLAYPLINLAEGLAFPRMPTFGVPCPTTVFTLGLLLVADPPSWGIAIIPLLWSLLGVSAVFLLDVRADLALVIGAAFLVTSLATARRRRAA